MPVILVLCTGNSARSILAEVLFNALGAGQVSAVSAGSQPKGAPHPLALETLIRHGHGTTGLCSKSWDVFAEPGAPEIDAVITVCDSAAAESCPIWPGAPLKSHWGLPDPAGIEDEAAARAAFEATYQALRQRISAFMAQLERAPDDLAGALAAGRA
ncbi:MAG: arsenate reductase ArsC [Pseudomonadota bacterium]